MAQIGNDEGATSFIKEINEELKLQYLDYLTIEDYNDNSFAGTVSGYIDN